MLRASDPFSMRLQIGMMQGCKVQRSRVFYLVENIGIGARRVFSW